MDHFMVNVIVDGVIFWAGLCAGRALALRNNTMLRTVGHLLRKERKQGN